MTLEILAQMQQQPTGGSGFFGVPIWTWLLLGATAVISFLVSGRLKSKFKHYSQIPASMTGAQVAERMLRENDIHDVKVLHVPGRLTDHYDPAKKTVNLSESVYGSNSVAAAAVAAHECGHAIQHQQAYAWLQLRSKMVPAVSVASQMMSMLMMMMFFGAFVFVSQIPLLIYIFLGAMGVTVLFSLVTLPVEFDASKRALAWLDSSGSVRGMEHDRANDALFWAAMTYVAGALAAIAQLVFWATMLLGNRE